MQPWLMVALDFPPSRGGIQTYLCELARRLPAVHVVAPAAPDGATSDTALPASLERVRFGSGGGWLSVPPLIARAAARMHTGAYAGVLFGHAKLAAALPLFGAWRTAVVTYGMEVTCGRFKTLERAGLARAWRVIAVSDYTGRRVTEAGVAPDRVRRVHPGVALPEPFTRGASSEGPVLLSVGRLSRAEGYKGQDRVIALLPELARRHPGVRYVVAGDGDARPDLEAHARAHGVANRVRFAGAVPAAELARLYATADVFVLPTTSSPSPGGERFEGFGIVYLEAAAHGCPVVAGRAGGSPEAVADGETGLVVDAAAPGALLEALDRLCADPALRRRMGEAGRERVAREFTWDHAAERLARVLEEP